MDEFFVKVYKFDEGNTDENLGSQKFGEQMNKQKSPPKKCQNEQTKFVHKLLPSPTSLGRK